MDKKSNWKEFHEVLIRNNINRLYHFTDRTNLESIIKNGGLYSWKDCQNKGIKIPKPGGGGQGSLSWSLDSKKGLDNYVRVSFTQHHPMMYAAINEGRISDSVILEIDPEVICWAGSKYADKNATRNDVNVGETIDDFKKIHFSSVKEVNHFVLLPEEQPYYQAEILVKNFIPLKYIKNIGDFGVSFKDSSTPKTPQSSSINTPDVIISQLWEKGNFGQAIAMAAEGLIPSSNAKKFIENYIEEQRYNTKYQREIIINNRSFRYLHSNGSSLTILAEKGKYNVIVFDNNYKASVSYYENEFNKLLSEKHFPNELIKEIGFICQQNYEERMSMGVMIQVLAHSEPMTEKFRKAVDFIMKEKLFLPDDFDVQICYFTQEQIDLILNGLSYEKKRYLFILMSKLQFGTIDSYESGDILKIMSSKRFLISAEITKRYNLPQK